MRRAKKYRAPGHPHSSWERPSNENNGLIREYLPGGVEITDHQSYLNAIADELNERPRQTLGFRTHAPSSTRFTTKRPLLRRVDVARWVWR